MTDADRIAQLTAERDALAAQLDDEISTSRKLHEADQQEIAQLRARAVNAEEALRQATRERDEARQERSDAHMAWFHDLARKSMERQELEAKLAEATRMKALLLAYRHQTRSTSRVDADVDTLLGNTAPQSPAPANGGER